MARSSRRPTFWSGSYLSNQALTLGGTVSFDLTPAADLTDEQGREPTLVRTFGRWVVGGVPDDSDSTHVADIYWGILLGGIGDSGLPSALDMADERWITTGYLRWVWYNAYYPVVAVPPIVVNHPSPRAYQGPWEMVDFESHAMRKAREGDSLIMRVTAADAGADTPDRVNIQGYIRALWKAQ